MRNIVISELRWKNLALVSCFFRSYDGMSAPFGVTVELLAIAHTNGHAYNGSKMLDLIL